MATPSITMIPSGYKADKVYSVLPTNGDGDLTFNRNDTGTRVNKSGLIEQVSTDVPRLDYSDGVCPSLLLEPTSLNLTTYSQDFSQSDWEKPSSVVTGGILSPDGTTNASKLVIDNGVDASATGAGLKRSFNISANTPYTYSIFVKKAELHNVQVRVGAGSANRAAYYFNLNDGSLLREDNIGFTNVSYSIKDYGSNWWRISISFTNSTVTTLTNYVWTFKNNDYTDDIGDGVSGVYVFGAQLEQKSILTSYIPTTTQTQSRSPDSALKTDLSSYTSLTAGVLYGEFAALSNEDTTYRVFSLSDGTGSEAGRVFIGFGSTNQIYAYLGGTSLGSFTPTDSTTFHKAAVKYENGSSKLFIDGVQIGTTNTTATVPSVLSRLGLDGGNQGARFNGKLKDLRVYNTALTDAELATLTTI